MCVKQPPASAAGSDAVARALAAPAPITHYENFPVASWLCPPRLRPPIAAIYHFARQADDLADEGEATAEQRLQALADYRREWQQALAGQALVGPRAALFEALLRQQRAWALPLPLLDDLLSAFEQDVAYTRDARSYPDRAALLDYCRRSANPIGRLLLHLHRVDEAPALVQSDAICSALQLINFWQDLSQDIPRGRHYLCDADLQRHGVDRAQLQSLQPTPASLALIAEQLDWAEALMRQGAPLVHRLPGRAGWELRLVVQGGLRIVERIRALGCNTLQHRPTLGRSDAPALLGRSLWMGAGR